LHFVRGHILTALGRHDDARRAFRNAINEDVCPLRAPDEVTQLVRQIATDGDVLRIDFDRLLESLATDGIPGADLFFDHVHPTIEGHRRLALAIVEEMVDAGLLSLHADWGDDTIDDVSRSVTGRIDDDAHGAALRNLAKVMGWAGKTEEALRLVDRAIQLGPSDAEAHYNRGLLLLRLGRDGEAEGSLLAAVRLRADFAEAYYDLALLRQSREAFADAESDYLQAIKLRPRYTQAHNNLGVVYERLGEGERARASYRRALELEPDHADANHNLGWLMARKGEGAEALPYLRLAVERRPGSAPFRQSLAETLEKEGFAAEAQEIREQAIPISGDGP
ncbi:MAG: tetratricopeptide repeat protein, partial [Acidobacteriota bacterium]|nr:tetratricopeptide repeat protein [Acidobacteriota bacterium]